MYFHVMEHVFIRDQILLLSEWIGNDEPSTLPMNGCFSSLLTLSETKHDTTPYTLFLLRLVSGSVTNFQATVSISISSGIGKFVLDLILASASFLSPVDFAQSELDVCFGHLVNKFQGM
jgi:hypothetical protein